MPKMTPGTGPDVAEQQVESPPAARGRAKERLRWWLRLTAALGVSAILVAFLLRRTSLTAIVNVLAASRWSLVLLGFAVYVAANWFKALRFRLATASDQELSRLGVFQTTCLYNMTTGLLPFGTGEVSYPYLMARWHGVRVTQSTPALVVTRLLDLLVVSLLFLISTVLIRHRLAIRPQLVIAAAGVFALAALGLVLAPWIGDWALRGLLWAGQHWLRRWQSLIEPLAAAGYRFIHNLRLASRSGMLIHLALTSLVIWALSYWVYQWVLHGLGYDLTYWMASFGGSLVLMTNLLPVQGIAGLGVREVGWVLGLTAIGLPADEATTLAFSIHAITLSYLVILGLLAAGVTLRRRPGLLSPVERQHDA